MKTKSLKRTILASVFGLAVLVGGSEVASAQTNKQIRKQQRKVERLENKTARQEQKLQNMRYRVYRNGSYYQTDSRGAELLRQAINRGYQEGVGAGQADRNNRRRSGWSNNPIYRGGNYGYRSHVDASQYQYYFR